MPETVERCALVSEQGERIATVGLGERVDPANAPHAANDSERLVFRQLYETLVRVDCEGRARPGLAASWRVDPLSPRTWIVTLREGARFADGSPVTSADVVSSWTDAATRVLRASLSRSIESLATIDAGTLAIALRATHDNAPLALADPQLAIARRTPDARWPLGTRDVRVTTEQPDSRGRTVITLAGPAFRSAGASENPSSMRFVVAPERDRRDFLDEGVDVLLTRDPTALDYATTLPQFHIVPLAWRRTHVFLSPWREPSLPMPTPASVRALARDAVRGEVRGAEGPFWWQNLPDCDVARPPARTRPPTTNGRILYEQGDEASRDLAERVVGLARAARSGEPSILDTLLSASLSRTLERTVAMRRDELAIALERGMDAGYIISVDRAPLDPCLALRDAIERITWLDSSTIVPLVDTRLHVIVRRGRSGATIEGDGTLLLH